MVIITVRGGLVADVHATIPLAVVVEDWDCPPDLPLVLDFVACALTNDQVRPVAERLESFDSIGTTIGAKQ